MNLRRPRFDSFAVVLVLVYGAAALVLALTFAASRALDRSMRDFSQDPTEVLDGPAYVGYLTGVTTILWTTAAATSLLVWLATGRSRSSPFLWSALFVGVLLADDVFRLHESYYPQLGLPQLVVGSLYGAAAAAYLWFFRAFIRANAALLFLVGLALLATSIAVDQFVRPTPWAAEDGAKFLGVLSWAVFYVRAALRGLTPLAPAGSSAARL